MPRKTKGHGKTAIGVRKKRKVSLEASAEIESIQEMSGQTLQLCQDFFLNENVSNADSEYVSDFEVEDNEGSRANEFYLIADEIIQCTTTDDVDSIYHKRMSSYQHATLKSTLRDNILHIQDNTKFLMMPSTDVKFVSMHDSANPGVKCTVKVCPETFKAEVFVHRRQLCDSHDMWKTLPDRFDTYDNVMHLLKAITDLKVCLGNPDEEFCSLEPGTNGFRENDFGAILGGTTYSQTIRHNDCALLVSSVRCLRCIDLRCSLRKKKSKRKYSAIMELDSEVYSKRAKHSNMSKEQLCVKVQALQKERRTMTAEIVSLRKKLRRSIEQCEKLDDSTSSDISELVRECSEHVSNEFTDKNSFQRLFWMEQLRYNKLKKPSGMRWHPMIIKWCLQIKSRSTKAYETLRDIGFVKLPSSRILYNYSHFMESKCGINKETVSHLVSECKAKGLFDTNWKQFIGILQDEVRIKEDLVYDKHTGELIGFVDLDNTGNQLLELENGLTDQRLCLARYMLVVMVRGIASDLKYPLACYATDGITSDFLYTIIWSAIRTLEVHVGLKVLFVTCDGASPNRKFFKMHGNGEVINSTENPYDPDRKIFFISDVPHLIKTARNCFSNSESHNMSRKFWNNGKTISWMHIVDLYNDHVRNDVYVHCPKLTKKHIDLDAYSKMNVSLAAQVLSSTVAHALEHLYGETISGTVEFLRYMNKFFDCLNTKCLNEGRNKRNPYLHPYTSSDDERLDWLLNDFLGYFENWKTSVNTRPGNFTKDAKNRMQISHQTITGMEISVRSIVELVKFLLAEGVPFILTNVFNQDPLEQHFGHCRHLGGSQDNPRVYDVRHTVNRLRAMGSTTLAVPGCNAKRANDERQVIDNSPLKKLIR